ncbi:kelch-like protein 28 [Anneissia japonica]|uniref:kelch-like protein 28 n=1 Tax=Anneissia japonica TaxID=1529436 RepID=UPI0014259ED3|nr:kelch-like protein 28 [Anneissia japonica]
MDEVAEFSKSLLKSMAELRQAGELLDITLKVSGRKVRAHRIVLASGSPYFKAMLTGSLCEREKEEIELKGIDDGILRTLVEFLYSGNISVTEANVQNLLPAANLLQIKAVTNKCCEFLKHQIHIINCIGIAKFADTHDCKELYEYACDFIHEHFKDLCNSEEFNQMEPNELANILSSENLNVDSEENTFEMLERWLQYDPNRRRAYVPKLISHIRLPLMSFKYLTNMYENNEFICESVSAKEAVNRALQYHISEDRSKLMGEKKMQVTCRRPAKMLCAVGGKNGFSATLESVEIYHINTKEWVEVAPLSFRRLDYATAVHDRKLYVIGGTKTKIRSCKGSVHRELDSSVERWNPETNAWTPVANMLRCRSHHASAVFHGKIYALGGYDGETYMRSVECYCPLTNQWSLSPPMLKSRSFFRAVVANGMLYVIGGCGQDINSVERFDPDSETWEMVSPMADKRIDFGVAVLHNYIYVVGGHNGTSHLSSVERYDCNRNKWSVVASLNLARTGLGAAVMGHKLYAVGGHSGSSYLNRVEEYDPDENRWQVIDKMLYCRCNLGLEAL